MSNIIRYPSNLRGKERSFFEYFFNHSVIENAPAGTMVRTIQFFFKKKSWKGHNNVVNNLKAKYIDALERRQNESQDDNIRYFLKKINKEFLLRFTPGDEYKTWTNEQLRNRIVENFEEWRRRQRDNVEDVDEDGEAKEEKEENKRNDMDEMNAKLDEILRRWNAPDIIVDDYEDSDNDEEDNLDEIHDQSNAPDIIVNGQRRRKRIIEDDEEFDEDEDDLDEPVFEIKEREEKVLQEPVVEIKEREEKVRRRLRRPVEETDSETEADSDNDDIGNVNVNDEDNVMIARSNYVENLRKNVREQALKEQESQRVAFGYRQYDENILQHTFDYLQSLQDKKNWTLTCEREPGEDMKLHPVQLVNTSLTNMIAFKKLLMVAPTGIGKTIMIAVTLNQYFSDTRPKIILSPQANQYYNELFVLPDQIGTVPNHYKIFIRALWQKRGKQSKYDRFIENIKKQKQGRLEAKEAKKLNNTRNEIIEVLSLKNMFRQGRLTRSTLEEFESLDVPYPKSPFRILSLMRNKPVDYRQNMSVFKFPYNEDDVVEDENVEETEAYYLGSNNIFLIDEFHNVYSGRNDPKWPHQELVNILKVQRGSRVYGYTATPIVNDVKTDFEYAMSIIKGNEYADKESNAGFYTYYNSFPTSVFPMIQNGNPLIPSNLRKMIRYVSIKDQSMYRYRTSGDHTEDFQLSQFLNFGHEWKKFSTSTRLYKALKMFQKLKTVKDWNVKMNVLSFWSSKFYQLIADIKQIEKQGPRPNKKILILGFDTQHLITLAFILSGIGYKIYTNASEKSWANKKIFKPYTAAKNPDDDFNRVMFLYERSEIHKLLNRKNNKRGKEFRIILANLKYYNESVDFFHIRHLMLLNPPRNGLEYSQYVGRAIRFCSHADLSMRSRNLKITVYCGVYPNIDEEEEGITSDQRDLRLLLSSLTNLNAKIDELKRNALDYQLLRDLM